MPFGVLAGTAPTIGMILAAPSTYHLQAVTLVGYISGVQRLKAHVLAESRSAGVIRAIGHGWTVLAGAASD